MIPLLSTYVVMAVSQLQGLYTWSCQRCCKGLQLPTATMSNTKRTGRACKQRTADFCLVDELLFVQDLAAGACMDEQPNDPLHICAPQTLPKSRAHLL